MIKEVYMSVASSEPNGRTAQEYRAALRDRGISVGALHKRAPHAVLAPGFKDRRLAPELTENRSRLHASRLASFDRGLSGPLGQFCGALLMIAARLDSQDFAFDENMQRDVQAMHNIAEVAGRHGVAAFVHLYPDTERDALERMRRSHLPIDEDLAALEQTAHILRRDQYGHVDTSPIEAALGVQRYDSE